MQGQTQKLIERKILRSYRYRVTSNSKYCKNDSLTIDHSECNDNRNTPSFVLPLRVDSGIQSRGLAQLESKSSARAKYRHKQRSVYVKLGDVNMGMCQTTIDSRMQTARTFETFMDRQGTSAWKTRSRIKLPLIQSSPEISFLPFPLQYSPIEEQTTCCLQQVQQLGGQISQLQSEMKILSERAKELDPFVEAFMSKCSGMRNSLVQNRIQHCQYMGVLRSKIVQQQQDMGTLHSNTSQSIQDTHVLQKSIFDSSYDLEFQPVVL